MCGSAFACASSAFSLSVILTCALCPPPAGTKRALGRRDAHGGREQADDISCGDVHIHNSANKLQERSLIAEVGLGGDRFAHLRFLRVAAFPFLYFLEQENIGRVYDSRVTRWQLKL